MPNVNNRTKTKTLEVTCPRPECTHGRHLDDGTILKDSFIIRYEVETDENGNRHVSGTKAVDPASSSPKPDVPKAFSEQSGEVKHKCPWCREESIFSVPL